MDDTRRILLIEHDREWEARDLDVEVSVVGETCDEALTQLDGVVAAVRGESGHPPSDEELRAVGVDSEANHVYARLREQVDEFREESVFGDAAPEDLSVLNKDSDGDRTLDDIFPGDKR